MLIVFALLSFIPALYYFSLGMIACWGTSSDVLQCDLSAVAPWVIGLVAIGGYLFILWIVHELGREVAPPGYGERPLRRVAIAHLKSGYFGLDKGFHRHVRRAHRIAAVILGGIAAYISFYVFKANTWVNLCSALVTYIIVGEVLNWKRYSKLVNLTKVAELHDTNKFD